MKHVKQQEKQKGLDAPTRERAWATQGTDTGRLGIWWCEDRLFRSLLFPQVNKKQSQQLRVRRGRTKAADLGETQHRTAVGAETS